jgi:hypothetical protein
MLRLLRQNPPLGLADETVGNSDRKITLISCIDISVNLDILGAWN